MIKPFDDFLNTITDEEFNKMDQVVSEKLETTSKITSGKNNLLGNQIFTIAVAYSEELLRYYHEWLSKQL